MKFIYLSFLALVGGSVHHVYANKSSSVRRRLQEASSTTDDEAPIYPVVVETVGTDDPLLTDLRIPSNASVAGAWSTLEAWPSVAIHAAVLPDGKFITYGAATGRGIQDGRTFIFWDPKLGFGQDAFTEVSNAHHVDSFCSTGVLLTDGTFLSSGGAGETRTADRLDIFHKSVESSTLDYRTQTAWRAANLHYPRWYGTMTKLADGRSILTGGGGPYIAFAYLNREGDEKFVSETPEIYTEGKGWKMLLGAQSFDAFGPENNRYWYPHQWVSPTGTVFGVSTEKMWEMDVSGNGTVNILGDFKVAPDDTSDATPNTGPTSSAVMYDTGKILQMGGNGLANGYNTESSAEATIFDITGIANGTVTVNDTSPMIYPRQWHNAVVLPDGQVLVTGGTKFGLNAGEDTVFAAEIWNPTTGAWTHGSSATVFRGYHQSSALLPTGAVFTGGGGLPGPVVNFNAEIYFPPYFFERNSNGTTTFAKRPRIVSISANALNYGDVIQVQVASGDIIKEVSLSAMPANTHSFDSNQRRMTLSFMQSTAGPVTVTLPSSPNLAPPGYFYLSMVNDKGVPSECTTLSLSAASPPVPGQTFPNRFEPITGAFSIEANVRFDRLFENRRWQFILDWSNGPRNDDILFGQYRDSTNMLFSVYRDNVAHHLVARNVLEQGVRSNWKAGVNETGWMYIEKDGVRVAEQLGHVPRNVYRSRLRIGDSNWGGGSTLIGNVAGIKITNEKGYDNGGLLNVPKQVTGAFTAEAIVVFHDLGQMSQNVFDFGSGPAEDNVVLTQFADSRDMAFEIWRDMQRYRVIARDAIVLDELATWRVGVESTGQMWIEKNGERLASGAGVLPRNVFRRNLFVGDSNWPGDDSLIGAVLGLRVTNEVERGVPEQITGPFTAQVTARFDNLIGGHFQRLFDFGNGPFQDNIVVSQFSRSDDMMFEVWRYGTKSRLRARNCIVEGEIATWRVGVDPSGLMWIEKNGRRLKEKQGMVPRDVYRANMLFGESNWMANDPLAGIVLGHDVTNLDDESDGGLLNIPAQITGAFSVEVIARFDDVLRGGQQIFDFGNGPEVNSILFGQFENTTDARLDLWKEDRGLFNVVAPGAIVQGEMAVWRVGVDSTGLMWIEKDGNRLAEGPGSLPENVVRTDLLIGESNSYDTKLDGVVLGLRVSTDGLDPFETAYE